MIDDPKAKKQRRRKEEQKKERKITLKLNLKIFPFPCYLGICITYGVFLRSTHPYMYVILILSCSTLPYLTYLRYLVLTSLNNTNSHDKLGSVTIFHSYPNNNIDYNFPSLSKKKNGKVAGSLTPSKVLL